MYILKKFRLQLSLLIALVLLLVFSSFQTFAQTAQALESDLLRLHIIANSDDEADQQLKLALRDFLLENDDKIFKNADSIENAKKNAELSLSEIERLAALKTKELGFDYPVKAELVNMYFTTRVYDNVTLPAGNYDALRITLGSGEGKNWWCVLYPPLCISAAADTDGFFSDSELDLIKNGEKYKIKFMAYEIFQKIFNSNK